MAGEDYFALLGLPRQADLAEGEIQARYHERIAECHPDRASTEEERGEFSQRSSELNQAWNTLRNPVTRVRHLLSLIAPDLERDASLSQDLMELFAETGQALQAADAFLAQKRKATSALARALLAEQEMEVQEGLQDALGKVTQAGEALDLSVREPQELRGLHTQLSFLDRWQRQLNEKLLLLLMEE